MNRDFIRESRAFIKCKGGLYLNFLRYRTRHITSLSL